MKLAVLLLLALLEIAGCATGSGLQTANAACSLVRLSEVPMDTRGNMLFVHAFVGRTPVTLLADTGAERTLLTEATVRRLRLPRDPLHATRTFGIGAPTLSWDAKLPDGMMLDGQRLPLTRLSVGDFAIAPVAGTVADGLLGADVLSAFDIDLDLPAHTMTLYRARRSCPQAVPPWPGPYYRLDGIVARDDRLLVPFELDGVAGMGVLDTGAQLSSISQTMASRAGMVEAALTMDRTVIAHGAAAEQIPVRIHRFRELRVGPAMIQWPALPVVSMTNGMGDALIGADFMQGRRIWLSFATHLVFVTPLEHGQMMAEVPVGGTLSRRSAPTSPVARAR
jgi:predicted aspartyl protease